MKTLKQQIEAVESAKKARRTFLNEEKVRESFLFDKNVSPPLADDDPQYAGLCDAAETLRGMEWKPIETSPISEHEPFLVRRPGNDMADMLVEQVSRFEGRMYPDAMNGAIDWSDATTDATEWMPLPPAPLPQVEGE